MAVKVPTFTLFDDNDQYIQLTGLFSYSADEYGNLTVKNYESAATVSATLVDVNGTPVTGLTDIPMEYIVGSQEIYRGPVASTFNATPGSGLYTLIITAVTSGGQLQFNIPTTIAQRITQ